MAEIGRRDRADSVGRAWAVSARVKLDEGEIALGVGLETPEAGRRQARIGGEAAAPAKLAEWLRPIWLTPAQDRLFLDGAGERRRFLVRRVFAAELGHGAAVAAYERALRERGRLLAMGAADPTWLTALEARMAEAGALVAVARAEAVAALGEEIVARGEGVFNRELI